LGGQWLEAYEAEERRELLGIAVSLALRKYTVVETYSLLLSEISRGSQYYNHRVVLELDVAVNHDDISDSF
jgi:hypothetical protein